MKKKIAVQALSALLALNTFSAVVPAAQETDDPVRTASVLIQENETSEEVSDAETTADTKEASDAETTADTEEASDAETTADIEEAPDAETTADTEEASDAGRVELAVTEGAVSVVTDAASGSFTVRISNEAVAAASEVLVPVWCAADQSDIHWYQARKDEYGWVVAGSTANHKYHSGRYYADVYRRTENGLKYSGGTAFEVEKRKVEVSVSDVDPSTGKFTVSVSSLSTPSDLKAIRIPVWSAADQSDIYWYTAVRQGDKYVAECTLANHGYHNGKYLIDVYLETENGRMECVSSTAKDIRPEYSEFRVADSDGNGIWRQLKLGGLTTFEDGAEVEFAIWSSAGGQDDLLWYGTKKSGDTYTATFDLTRHMTAGLYNVDAYIKHKDGSVQYAGGMTFNIDALPQEKTEIINIDQDAGTFDVRVTVLSGEDTYKDVVIPVWSAKDQSDLVWYEAKRQTDGTWLVHCDIANHNTNVGLYHADAYLRSSDGSLSFLTGAKAGIAVTNYVVATQISECLTQVTIYGPSVGGKPATSVYFPTWSEEGGQDDLVWHEGTAQEDGSFTALIYRGEHKSDGLYTTDVYPANSLGQECVDRVTYTMAVPTNYDDYAAGVMRKIIYAVETGGQVYGNARYDCFAQAFKNTKNETAITIGAGGWFANEAKRLLNRIRTANPAEFVRLDTAGIGNDLDNLDWQYYGSDGKGNVTIAADSPKALCIQKLINTTEGRKAQDELLDEQMAVYVKEAADYGVTDLKARMFMANVRHLGGLSAMKRVINNCVADGKPLTMENLWQAMLDHDSQEKTASQVGSPLFHSRHKRVMEWLNKYIG